MVSTQIQWSHKCTGQTPPTGCRHWLVWGRSVRHCPRPAGGLGEVRLALRKEAPALTHPPGPAPQHQLCVGAPTRAPQDQRPCAVGRGAGGTRAWTPQRLTAPYKLPRCMGDGGEVPTNVCIVPCSETGLAPPLPLPGAQGSLAPPASRPLGSESRTHPPPGPQVTSEGAPVGQPLSGQACIPVDRC